MNVLIVAKTRMGEHYCCVGGLDLESTQCIRLLQSNGYNQPVDTPFDVGQIWDLEYARRNDVVPPHVEDVLVGRGKRVGQEPNILEFLLQSIELWRGGPEVLFDGMLCATKSGSGYICEEREIPDRSVGFWMPDMSLMRADFGEKVRYHYPGDCNIRYLTYTGVAGPENSLEAGSLIRVSLARWWKPENQESQEERCYLQLSGWY